MTATEGQKGKRFLSSWMVRERSRHLGWREVLDLTLEGISKMSLVEEKSRIELAKAKVQRRGFPPQELD